MMRKKQYLILLLTIFLLVSCNDNENWKTVEDEQVLELLIDFINDYHNSWTSSLEQQSFSMIEPYFIANSHVYHMQRRQHQQLIGERKREEVIDVAHEKIEQNDYQEYKLMITEEVEINEADHVTSEQRTRSYYVADSNRGYKITLIEREN
ncbi:TcaA NTF2-like domain-containing protein [Evansella halocellulosilytica]|uniref:TcaA NTF2-like domain-containing protein n=1 Tax=Evansella halocellulosilytica TaxID=2011013 RepID=UPI000BB7F5B7|nr:hypothetical protein [Evansella halocellulosilytica]